MKENIIIGHLIPAGTGVFRYHDVEFDVDMGLAREEDEEFTTKERELFPSTLKEASPAD